MDEEVHLFKALAEVTRLRLAIILAHRGETCVCDLAKAIEAPDFKISRHLGIMKSAGLVIARREGTWMHYQLSPADSELKKQLQTCLLSSFSENKQAQADLKRISQSCCTF